MIEQEISKYLKSGKYLPIEGCGGRSYRHVLGWTNHTAGQGLLYSHRVTDFKRDQFDEAYHAHSFYELIVYLRGDVDFICNQSILKPPQMSVIWSCPGEYHNARLLGESCYERYVFRFEPDVFLYEGQDYATLGFTSAGGGFFEVGALHQSKLERMLSEIDACFEGTRKNRLLARALFIRLMDFLDRIADLPREASKRLPQNVLDLKLYVEEHYQSISSVREVAARFFYSREHVSRLFQQYFNMSVAEYLTRYRIARSVELLEAGKSVTETCYAVGFGSMSAFSSSFRRVKGCLPSHWTRRGD
ncbi:MAG: helix-turn-helix domain-containing protein [Ruminococcaceae bacterium]|nr:helix-turn-helix domain-containing protein [Oscillospiraceae bacterium]